MVDRDILGAVAFIVRGEIVGFVKDRLLRRMLSLIKNES